jgi:HK97 family phage portal protein
MKPRGLKKGLKKGRYDATPTQTDGAMGMDQLAAFFATFGRGGVSRRPEDYLAVGAINAAVNRLATTFAYLDRQVVQYDAYGRRTVVKHYLNLLLANPNNEMSSFEFWRTVFWRYLFRKGAFVEIGEGATELLLPEIDKVKPRRIGEDLVYMVDGGEDLEPCEVLHFRGPSFDGFTGSTPFEDASTELDLALNALEFAKNFFENGGAPSGYYTSNSKSISPKLLEYIKEQHRNEIAGIKNVGRTPVLSDGFEWRPIGGNPEQSQLSGVRSAAVADVARLLNLPLSLLDGDPSESAKTQFVECLRSHGEVFEAECTFKLLTPAERAVGMCIEHDFSALRRSDPTAKVDDLTKGFGFGAVTIDEWRQGCGLEPLADGSGDMRLVATNNLDSVQNVEDVKTLDAPEEPKAIEGPKEDSGPTVKASSPAPSAVRAVFADQVTRLVRRGRKALSSSGDSAKVYATEARQLREFLPSYAALVGADLEDVVQHIQKGYDSQDAEADAVEGIVWRFCGGNDG